MSDDIVDRRQEWWSMDTVQRATYVDDLIAEIERYEEIRQRDDAFIRQLQAEIERLQERWSMNELAQEIERAQDEIERLRADAKRNAEGWSDAVDEIGRLRARLESARSFIADSPCTCLPYAQPGDGTMCPSCEWLSGDEQ